MADESADDLWRVQLLLDESIVAALINMTCSYSSKNRISNKSNIYFVTIIVFGIPFAVPWILFERMLTRFTRIIKRKGNPEGTEIPK